LVHRSLKPENILLTHQQGKLVVKISDFALAKAFGTAGLSGHTMAAGSFAGTPYYMPRAQLMNFQTVQPAVDVWAAAACFYELLTGVPPRNFGDSDEIRTIAECPAVPIGERVSYVPSGLAEVLDRALREEADHSTFYQSALAFKQDLLSVW
jgi:serine/threonine protein kinase